MLKISEVKNQQIWDDFINNHGGHPLQLWGWGELKSRGNWRVCRIFVHQKTEKGEVLAAAQILTQKMPWPLKNFAYIPRGILTISGKPLEREKMLQAVAEYCKTAIKPRPVALSVEPDWEEFPNNLLKKGWIKARNTVLIPRTLILDLTKSTDEILMEMHKNNRQLVKKSAKNCAVRRLATPKEFETAYKIYLETAKRAGFSIHSEKYYQDLRDLMGDNSPVWGAFSEDELIAFSWIAKTKTTAFELYGGSNDKGRDLWANYAIKWAVIQELKEQGVERYDFNGLLNDSISLFKKRFARHENLLAGTFDRPLSKWYPLWSHGLPIGKKIVRSIRKILKKSH
ncbi:MAG: peptidoglycan bridge formation glycyltransferase FemA/FemB family protein [bacterium]|nr:peptidoglycan bridge formation glycyltransferase FemA/FemB family protein [bacterium]